MMKRLFFIFIGLSALVGFASFEPKENVKKAKKIVSSERTEKHERKW